MIPNHGKLEFIGLIGILLFVILLVSFLSGCGVCKKRLCVNTCDLNGICRFTELENKIVELNGIIDELNKFCHDELKSKMRLKADIIAKKNIIHNKKDEINQLKRIIIELKNVRIKKLKEQIQLLLNSK